MKQIPMSLKQQTDLRLEIIKHLHKEVFAKPETIATVLEKPVSRIVKVLLTEDFYHDDKGRYALKGKARQMMNNQNTAA